MYVGWVKRISIFDHSVQIGEFYSMQRNGFPANRASSHIFCLTRAEWKSCYYPVFCIDWIVQHEQWQNRDCIRIGDAGVAISTHHPNDQIVSGGVAVVFQPDGRKPIGFIIDRIVQSIERQTFYSD